MSQKADFEEISGDISLLYELSLAVGGVLAGSRPVIDAGWLPPDRRQI